MNSRLDWLVLSDYYSIYVTYSPPKKPDGTVGFFAVKREITVIVFNI